jgi:hypothetical protein
VQWQIKTFSGFDLRFVGDAAAVTPAVDSHDETPPTILAAINTAAALARCGTSAGRSGEEYL